MFVDAFYFFSPASLLAANEATVLSLRTFARSKELTRFVYDSFWKMSFLEAMQVINSVLATAKTIFPIKTTVIVVEG